MIINEDLAQRFWPNEDALGKRMELTAKGPWRTIVGIVRDAKEFRVDKDVPIGVYFPTEQVPTRSMFMVVRTTSDPAPMTAMIAKEIQALDPELPTFDVKTMAGRLSESLAWRRFSTFLLEVFAGAFALITLTRVMSSLLYGVTATDAPSFIIPPWCWESSPCWPVIFLRAARQE